MKNISPEMFAEAFNNIALAYKNKICALWDDSKGYTTMMRKEILPQIAQNINLLAYSEKDYYWLDAIFYESPDTEHFKTESPYAKYIAVAIEHEHRIKGTEVEINKLQLFNASLKVLISYPGKNREKFLSRYAKIIENADVFSDASTLRKQLVVFGYKSGEIISWKFFYYDSSRFKQIILA